MKIDGLLFAAILLLVAAVTYIISVVIMTKLNPKRIGPSYATTNPDTINLINSINNSIDKNQPKVCGDPIVKDIKTTLDKYLPDIIKSCSTTDSSQAAAVKAVSAILTTLLIKHPLILGIFTFDDNIILKYIVPRICNMDSSTVGQKVNDISTKIGMLIDAMCN